MEVKIVSQEKNELTKRVEAQCSVTHSSGATPSRKDLQVKIAAKLDTKPELVVVKKIDSQFGSAQSSVVAYAYDTTDEMVAMEPKYVVEKNKYEEAKPEPVVEEPKAEAAPEPKADEAPAEEPPEQPKTEEPAAEEKKEEAKAE